MDKLSCSLCGEAITERTGRIAKGETNQVTPSSPHSFVPPSSFFMSVSPRLSVCIGAAGSVGSCCKCREGELQGKTSQLYCTGWLGDLKEVGVMLLLTRLAVLLVTGLASLSCSSDGEYRAEQQPVQELTQHSLNKILYFERRDDTRLVLS